MNFKIYHLLSLTFFSRNQLIRAYFFHLDLIEKSNNTKNKNLLLNKYIFIFKFLPFLHCQGQFHQFNLQLYLSIFPSTFSPKIYFHLYFELILNCWFSLFSWRMLKIYNLNKRKNCKKNKECIRLFYLRPSIHH